MNLIGAARLLLLSAVMVWLHFCEAQVIAFDETCIDCDDSENCNCIADYTDLESYVLNDQSILSELREAFYSGGEASDIVRITYTFNALTPSSNDTKDDTEDEYETFNCTNLQDLYIWSDLPVYLMGPRAVYWLTLFAMDVQEANVTIKLPVFCNDAYDNLLPRLTRMIKPYAVIGYHDEPIQFVTRNFFHAKGQSSEDIASLWIYTIIVHMTMYGVAAYSVFYFINPPIKDILEAVSLEENKHLKSLFYIIFLGGNNKAHQLSGVFFFCILLIALIVFNVLSNVELIEYGNEVFKEDQREILFAHFVTSLIIVFAVLLMIPLSFISYIYYKRIIVKSKLTAFILSLIASTITYLSSYFLPYMILAFISKPLRTVFVYSVLTLFAIVFYLACWRTWTFILDFRDQKYHQRKNNFIISIITFYAVYSISIFSYMLLRILTLGTFNDYQETLKILLPSLVATISILGFVIKPKEKKKNDDKAKTINESVMVSIVAENESRLPTL